MVGFHDDRSAAPAPRSIIAHYRTYTMQQVIRCDAPLEQYSISSVAVGGLGKAAESNL